MTERTVPHSLEAEQALLGAFLLNADAVPAVSDIVRAEDFYEPIHGQVFKACVSLAREGRALMPATLRPLLPDIKIGDLSMSGYLARLLGEATTVINAPDIARVIAEAAARRRLIAVAQEIEAAAFRTGEGAESPRKISEAAVLALMSADGADDEVEIRGIEEIEASVIQSIQRAVQGEDAPGFASGMSFVDELTGPLQPGDLVVIGGRSGGGKTAFALQILQHLSRQGAASAFFSLEMPGEQLAQRGLSARADVSASAIASAAVNIAELEKLVDAHRSRAGYLVDIVRQKSGRMSMATIEAIATKQRARKQIAAIAIDHLQLIAGDHGRRYRGDQFDVIQDAVFRAKLLANRLGIVVFLLSQLKRDDEQTERFTNMNSVRRPRSEHLYGGDQIVQAADKVLLIHRPITQLDRMHATNDEAHGKLTQARAEWADRAEILLDKRRNGKAPRRRTCRFLGETMRFLPLHDEDSEEMPF